MLKGKRMLTLALSGLLMSITPLFAADYAAMSTEELAAMRGTMRNAGPEEHAAFQHEWQNRIRQMTQEEQRKYLGPPENAPRDGSGMQSGQGGTDRPPGGGTRGGMGGMGGGGKGGRR
ncbi:MAG: hypothetical protein ACYCYR_04140 [Desulfobulbaceae bacterium]